MEVVNGLIRGTVDLKRGELILRALNAAVRNSKRANFDTMKSAMVTRIPDYTESEEPTPLAKTVGEMYEDAIANRREAIAGQEAFAHPDAANVTPAPKPSPERANAASATTPNTTTAHVGTDAALEPALSESAKRTTERVRPGGPESPGRSTPTTKQTSAITSTPIDPTKRKQPMSVKEVPTSAKAAPKERKIAAHRAIGG